jgi:hypothetical protein
MSRLNLTLDKVTFARLGKRAKKEGAPRAALARRLVQEGLDQMEALERRRKLVADYSADRADIDIKDLLHDLEARQFELLADEDNA